MMFKYNRMCCCFCFKNLHAMYVHGSLFNLPNNTLKCSGFCESTH